MTRHLAHVLRELGFRSRVRLTEDLGPIVDADDPRQGALIGPGGWLADSPRPGPFLSALISCGSDFNAGRFCDRGIDTAIDRAQAAGSEAGAAWQRIERRISEQAPVVPLTTRRVVEVTSRRAGNLQVHLILGVLLEQVWVR